VGKHSAKFAYEQARRVCARAELKTFASALARGPGARAVGGGGGEGERGGSRGVAEGMVVICERVGAGGMAMEVRGWARDGDYLGFELGSKS